MMESKRIKAFFLLGVMILSLILCSCSPVPATDPSETEPSPTRSLIDLTPDSGPKEGSDSFYDDRVLVGLKPGFGGINKEINISDFAAAGIILESEITEDTDLSGKIVITSVVDNTYTEKPELYNPDTFVQELCFFLAENSKDNVLELVDRMQRLEEVEYAQPEYIYTIKDLTVSDGLYNEQWGLTDGGINISKAWELIGDGETTPTIRIGIFESGIQMDHPDLHTGIGYFTPATTASQDHGTHVAGIIGAIADNGVGVAGVAQVEIVLLNPYDFVGSLLWAAQNGIRIVNASFTFLNSGGTDYADYDISHISAIQQFGQAGGVLICAAGNDGESTDENPAYPAAYSDLSLFPNITNVISVGWLNQNGDRNDHSNYGLQTVDIYAPGNDILSTFPESICEDHSGVFSDGTRLCEWSASNRDIFYEVIDQLGINLEDALNHFSDYFLGVPSDFADIPHQEVGYHYMSGTSMAAPHVTGVAALLLSIDSDLTVEQISSAILNSAETITITLPDSSTQSVKELDAYNAVKYVLSNYSSSATISSSSTTLSKTIDLTSTYFDEINYFVKLNVGTAGNYDFIATSTSALDVTLYDSSFNEINISPYSTNSGATKKFCRTLATGTYYLKVAYSNTANSGTISITIEPHSHSYDWWTYYNSTTHIESCCCGRTRTATAVHSIRSSEVVNNKANCMGCGYMLDLRYDIAVSIPDSVVKVSVNGSYILPSGIIVLVDEDVEAYLNGTLVFYDKDDLPVTQ